MKKIFNILWILMLLSFTGCLGSDPFTKAAGDINQLSGTFYYSFGIRTVPAGATVKINNEVKGSTPLRFGMKGPADYLQSNNVIEISMSGYKRIRVPFSDIDFSELPPPEHTNSKNMKHLHADLLYTLDVKKKSPPEGAN